jgi:hypothetical protein
MMFNAFLDLKTFIDTSMHTIPWEWPSHLLNLKRSNFCLGTKWSVFF